MSVDRPRIWIEEPSPAFSWALVACEFCVMPDGSGRTWFPVLDARAMAERHAWEHRNSAGLPPRVYEEAELVCVEVDCRRRAIYADGRCRACRARVRRAELRAAA